MASGVVGRQALIGNDQLVIFVAEDAADSILKLRHLSTVWTAENRKSAR
jgi:hypothetical protein